MLSYEVNISILQLYKRLFNIYNRSLIDLIFSKISIECSVSLFGPFKCELSTRAQYHILVYFFVTLSTLLAGLSVTGHL